MKVIYTTIANEEQAESIAQTLLQDKLVACINMWPITSLYTWKEKFEKSSEIAMFLKTTAECHDLVYKRLKELHTYECPAIITINVSKTDLDFMQWVQTQTKP